MQRYGSSITNKRKKQRKQEVKKLASCIQLIIEIFSV